MPADGPGPGFADSTSTNCPSTKAGWSPGVDGCSAPAMTSSSFCLCAGGNSSSETCSPSGAIVSTGVTVDAAEAGNTVPCGA